MNGNELVPDVGPQGRAPVSGADPARAVQDRVAEVVRAAVAQVPGVHGIGTQTQRRVAGAVRRIPQARTSWAPGLTVAVGADQVAADLSVVVEPGQVLHLLADDLRQEVAAAVEGSTGLRVVEVNVEVIDLHLPEDDFPPVDETVPATEQEVTADEPRISEKPVNADEPALSDDPVNPDEAVDPDVPVIPDDAGLTDEPARDRSPAEAAVEKAIDEIIAEERADSVVITETTVTTTEVAPADESDHRRSPEGFDRPAANDDEAR